MPIYSPNVTKLYITNKEGARGILYECVSDMPLDEQLERINELRALILSNLEKKLEEEKKKDQAKPEEPKKNHEKKD